MIRINPHSRRKITFTRLKTRTDRILTIANAVSMSRIFLAFLLIRELEASRQMSSLLIIGVIVLSDFLDGWIARKADQVSNFGKVIDPVADKVAIMIVSTYLLFEYGTQFFIYLLLVYLRDSYIVTIGVFLKFQMGEVLESTLTGKWFIGISAAMMFFYLFGYTQIGLVLYVATMILMLASTVQYVRRYINYFHRMDHLRAEKPEHGF